MRKLSSKLIKKISVPGTRILFDSYEDHHYSKDKRDVFVIGKGRNMNGETVLYFMTPHGQKKHIRYSSIRTIKILMYSPLLEQIRKLNEI